MEVPPWLLALGAGSVSAPGLWQGVKWIVSFWRGRTEAQRTAEANRVAGIVEREDRLTRTMEQALERLDADVKRLSNDGVLDRERISKLESENRTLRMRLDRLDSAVRVALVRLNDLMRWEEAGMPPPPPWSIKSIADLLRVDNIKDDE